MPSSFKKYFILGVLAILSAYGQLSFGQANEAVRVKERVPITGGERFDLVFTRGALLEIGDLPSEAPYEAAWSGSYSLGWAYGIPIGRVLALQLEPRFTWHNLVSTLNDNKSFPSTLSGDTLVYEKQRSFYFEVPIGMKFKLARNADKKVRLFLETGVFGGLLLSSVYKVRHTLDHDLDDSTPRVNQTVKLDDVIGLNPLRYGVYGRIGTNWVAATFQYRLSDIFDKDLQYSNGGVLTNYPLYPQWELGFSILL